MAPTSIVHARGAGEVQRHVPTSTAHKEDAARFTRFVEDLQTVHEVSIKPSFLSLGYTGLLSICCSRHRFKLVNKTILRDLSSREKGGLQNTTFGYKSSVFVTKSISSREILRFFGLHNVVIQQ